MPSSGGSLQYSYSFQVPLDNCRWLGPSSGNFPDTAVDYNILSNLPFKEQHWAKEDSRPRMKEKSPRVRRIPAFLCKDFDIVTNR